MKSPLRNASLTLKVALAPTLVLLCLVVVAVHGYLGNRSSAQALNGIVDASLPRMATTGALLQKTMQLNGMVMQSLAYEGAGFKAGVIAELDQRIGTEFKATRSMIVLAKEQFTGGSPEAQALLGTIATAFGTFERAALDTLDMKSAGLATASSMMSTSDSSYAALRQQLEALAQLEAREGGTAALTVKGLLERANTLNFFLTVTALGVSLALILFSLRLIVQPLTEARQIARSVAQGDLSGAAVEAGRDETGQVLQALADVRSKLGGIVSGIRSNALAIETASHEIADGSAHLSQRTENTAATLQTTSSSLTRVTASIRANADGAAEARRLSAEASAVATAGGKEVSAVIDIMSGIHADGRSITEIIGTIDSIAFQTNILALNAAVEAARAGDQGRGFAVVSSEVRALAQRSAEAARQVRALITASVERVDGGMDSVSRAGKTMQRIVDSIGQVNATVATMAEATMRQADTIQEVSAAVADIERDTQQNAALVEQASAAAETLNESAGGLVQAVAAFRVG